MVTRALWVFVLFLGIMGDLYAQPKRVLIFSMDNGSGHRTQGLALAGAVKDVYPDASIEYINALEYLDRIRHFAVNTLHIFTMRYFPWIQNTVAFHSSPDSVRRTIRYIMTPRLIKVVQSFHPDIILCPHSLTPYMVEWMMKRGIIPQDIPVITLITNYGFLPTYRVPFHILVPSAALKEALVASGKSEELVHVLPSLPVQKEFKTTAYDPREYRVGMGLHPHVPVILISGGGEGLFLEELYSFLKSWRPHHKVQVVFVTGKNKKLRDKLNRMQASVHGNIILRVEGYTSHMASYLKAADVHITKLGGGAMAESFATHTPIFAHHIGPAQERENARFARQHDVAYFLQDLTLLNNIGEVLHIAQRIRHRIGIFSEQYPSVDEVLRETIRWTCGGGHGL